VSDFSAEPLFFHFFKKEQQNFREKGKGKKKRRIKLRPERSKN
jgi:hypothetical protein